MKKIIYVLLPLLVVFYSCGNSNQNTDADNPEQEQIAEVEVVEEPAVVIEEKNYILKPGVTYVTETTGTGTDEFGGKVYLSMEFTIYTDGTATGNIIETNAESTYGNSNSYEHPVEGYWHEVSKHDKRFIKIDLGLQGYISPFTYFIDENMNAYANDINTRPVKLREK